MMEAFAAKYRGRVAGLDAGQLAQALDEYCEMSEASVRPQWYAGLKSSLNSADQATRDLTTEVDTKITDASSQMLFFGLEWEALPADRAARISSAPELSPYRHYLEELTANARYSLSEAEEKVAMQYSRLTDKWQGTNERTLGRFSRRVDTGDGLQKRGLEELLAMRLSPKANERRIALDATMWELAKQAHTLADCYDAVITGRLVSDKLRGIDSPMQPANLSNELADGVVDVTIQAIVDNYPLGQRWFRIKAKLLGVEKLSMYDQYAPLGQTGPCTFAQAKSIVLDAVRDFSPEAADIMAAFFEEGRIDALPRPGKRGGAFCSSASQYIDPFVLLNFTDTQKDALTLGHELGHGLHGVLAGRAQTAVTADTGMAMAEIASTFCEMLVFDSLLNRPGITEQERLALVSARVEDSTATIFRQVMMQQYESRAYARVADNKTLSREFLNQIWLEENQRQYGDSMEIPNSYKWGWTYVSHFINTRFYTYSYSFAHLVSLKLYADYRQAKADGTAAEFTAKYLDLLRSGGSKSPQEALAAVGIDITDPDWVEGGFAEFERILDTAEAITAGETKAA